MGHTINFKTRKHFKDKKSHYVSEDEWTIFENTHEAIIDQQTFDLVQKIRSNVRRYPNGWGEAAPLTGLLYCADCGGKMYVHRTNNGKRISQYTCSNYTKVPCGTLCPTQHRINESAVLTLFLTRSRLLLNIQDMTGRNLFTVWSGRHRLPTDVPINRKSGHALLLPKKRVSENWKNCFAKSMRTTLSASCRTARYKALDAQYAKEQDASLTVEIAESGKGCYRL